VVDECYTEIYDDTAPPSALEAAAALGGSLDHLIVMHSLSKRSNAAGLRSGFIAGDPDFLAHFLRLRAYGAAVQPLPVLAAAAALWADDDHVQANRAAYRAKIDLAEAALSGKAGFYRPPGGFFLWLDVGDGVAFAAELWRHHHVKVLPGTYLTASAGRWTTTTPVPVISALPWCTSRRPSSRPCGSWQPSFPDQRDLGESEHGHIILRDRRAPGRPRVDARPRAAHGGPAPPGRCQLPGACTLRL
jgi:hypothetical protein